MPSLKNRIIFISHSWDYHSHYMTVVNWLNEAPNFSWSNCSVPHHDALPGESTRALEIGLTRQIALAQIVLMLGGMYAAHSNWIDYEIGEAKRMGKIIIGVRPWGQERMPVKVQDASKLVVGWTRGSVIDAIRNCV